MLSIGVLIAHVACAVAAALHAFDQQPLVDHEDGNGKVDLIHELTKAEIIPTVLDSFTPLLTLSIFWPNATAEVGNTVDPARLQKEPLIEFLDSAPGDLPDDEVLINKEKYSQLTLALTDPDAPSRENPKWSQICHYIVTNVPLASSWSPSSSSNLDINNKKHHKLKTIMPYKPPGPPPKTGKHRYVFVALAPKNGTTEPLDLVKPRDRQHWGYGGEEKVGKGVREWAEEMGLGVVGANFVYAQNEKQ